MLVGLGLGKLLVVDRRVDWNGGNWRQKDYFEGDYGSSMRYYKGRKLGSGIGEEEKWIQLRVIQKVE